jgi:hypothetical protein
MIVTIRERFKLSGTVLIRIESLDKPLCLIDSGGVETYNEFRDDEDKTIFLGIDMI